MHDLASLQKSMLQCYNATSGILNPQSPGAAVFFMRVLGGLWIPIFILLIDPKDLGFRHAGRLALDSTDFTSEAEYLPLDPAGHGTFADKLRLDPEDI